MDKPFSLPEGTFPLDQWPVDVVRTDETGDVDLEQIEYNLSLTPSQRMEQYFQWLEFMEIAREAGRKLHGVEPGTLEAFEEE
jgi:hypothetical protein